ncbi:MAG: hypothetical protein ABIF17_02405 [Patescibacteria group bacterium]
MSEKIIITNKNELTEKIKKISIDGLEKFHVLSDFDKTLTKAFAPGGVKTASLIAVLRDEGYLTPDYPKKAKDLFNYYHAIEIDPKLSKEKKKTAMQEWWTKHFELLIASHLHKSDVEKAVSSQQIQLREGADEFLGFLHKEQIPLVIMSSSGLGVEAISLYLKSQNCFFDNIHIISNEFIWDKDGYAVKIKEPIIHSLSKEETLLKDFNFYDEVVQRKNVLLLGDSPDDIDMISGFEYKTLIKVGFWNKPTPENELIYQKSYDILIKNDGSMMEINKILNQIIKE